MTRLWYTNAVHEKQTLITGMTRDGTFLIEDGRITRPIEDLRFTDSVLRVLERREALTPRSGCRPRASSTAAASRPAWSCPRCGRSVPVHGRDGRGADPTATRAP